jgi:hypothetical protein
MPGPARSASPSGRASERRNHRRVPASTAVWLVVDDQRVPAECSNVSMGGAAVRTTALAKTGSVVLLELSLGADKHSVSIKCEVVRASGGELGLRFMALDRSSLEAILALL